MQTLTRGRSRHGIGLVVAATGILLLGAAFFTRLPGHLVRGPAFSILEQRYGVVATADRLDLDPVRLRLTIAGLTLSAHGHGDEPFLTVDEAVVDLPWTIVSGPAIDTLSLDGAALSVAVHADGSSNLPPAQPGGARPGGPAELRNHADDTESEPPPRLPIRRLEVRDLAVEWQDDAAGFAFNLPAAALRLEGVEDEDPDTDPERTNASGAASVSWRGVTTGPLPFAGALAYDGTSLRVDRLAVTGVEGALTASGLIDVLLGRPRMAINYEARLDLARLAARAPGTAASGAVSITGRLDGVADGFVLSMALAGGAVSWGGAVADRFDAALTLTPDAATLEALRVEVAGGVLSASGRIDAAAGLPGRLEAAWSGFDIGRLLNARELALSIGVDAVAEGSLAARWTALAPNAVNVSARNRLSPGAAGGGTRLEAEGGRWRLTIDEVVGRTARLSGNVEAEVAADKDGEPAGWRAARLAGGIVVHCEALGACIPADAMSERLHGSATARFVVGGSLGRPEVTGVLEAAPDDGRAGPPGFTAGIEADSEMVRVTVPPTTLGPNQVRGEVEVRLLDRSVDGFFSADLADLASLGGDFPSTLAPSGRGRWEAAVGGRLSQVQVDAVFDFDAVEIGSRCLGPVTGWAKLDRAGSLRGALRIPELAANIDAEVGLHREGAFNIRARFRHADPARLVGSAAPVKGQVTGEVVATGSLADLASTRVEVSIAEAAGTVGALKFGIARPGAVVYEAGALRTTGLDLALGRTRMQLAGGLSPLGEEALTARLSADAADLADLFAATYGLPATQAAGGVSLTLAATGTPHAIDLAGEMRIHGGSIRVRDHPPLTGLEARAALRAGVVRVEELRAAWEGAQIDGTAQLPLRAWLPPALTRRIAAEDRPARVRASVSPLSPAMLAGYLDSEMLDRLAGRVSAVLELEARANGLERTRGSLTLTEAALEVSGVPFAQRRPTVVVIENGRALLQTFDWSSEDNIVAMGGSVQLTPDLVTDGWVDGTLDLRTLSVLAPPVEAAGIDVGGSARVRARLTGPSVSPTLRGSVEIAAGEIRIAEPRLVITDLDGALSIDGDAMAVERLAGSANGGRVEIGGGWRMRGPPEENQLTLAGTGIALDIPRGLRTETDLDLVLREEEEQQQQLAVTGSVTVLRGAYREPITLAGGLIEALRQGTAEAAAGPDGETPGRVRLDVRVATGDDVVIDNNYVEAELSGDLRIRGTTDAPTIIGRVALREGGRVRFGNRVYEIDAGAVDFVDPEGMAPELTLTARTRAGSYDVTLDVSGDPDDLTTELRSEPPLPESDIAAVLLTGQPAGRGTAPLSGAGDQVLGLASTELLGRAGRGVGLDLQVGPGTPDADAEIRFDPSLVSTDLNPASRLTVGRNLRDDVRLVFSRSLRESDLAWFVDYLPRHDVELRAFFDDEDKRAYELRHAVSSAARTASAPVPRRVRVSSIAVRTDSGADTQPLRDLLSLRAGDTFDFHRQQRDRDRLLVALHQQGFLEARVQTRREPGPDADTVVLTYEILHGPLAVLAIAGYDLPHGVRRDLEAIWTRAVFDAFLHEELEARVAAHLRDRGYLGASIDARNVAGAGATASQAAGGAGTARDGASVTKRIEVRIDPGPRTEQRRLRFEGVGADDQRALREMVRARDLDRIAWTDSQRLATAVAAWHRDRGRLRATVQVGEPRFVGRTAELPVGVVPGPVFRFGGIAVSGTLAQPAAEVRAEAAFAEGDVYTEGAVAAARARIRAYYRRKGHTEATLTARTTVDDSTATVHVSFEVSEGPRQVVRAVVVEGATRTHPALIGRALDIEPGAPVDPVAWSQARKRLYDTGVFRRVDIEPIVSATLEPGAAEGMVPVEARVLLEEWPRYRFRYGFRIVDHAAALRESAGRVLRLGAVGDLSRRNLLGRGLTGGVSARADLEQRALRAFVTVPTLLGRPIETNLFVSRRLETAHASGIGAIDITTLTAEQRLRPRPGTMLAVAASVDRSRAADVVALPESLLAAGWNIARVDGSVVVDTRDNPFDATRGFYHSSNLEYGVQLGGSRAFLKYLGQQFVHRRVGRFVLASGARFGLAAGHGAELLPTERFFAGGGNTVRGHAQDSLGPSGPTGIPHGGHGLLILNQELRAPLWKGFGGVGFIDAGNVFRSVRDVSLRSLRIGAGAGLRFQSPIGLLRLDYGFTFRRRQDESRGRVFVSLGQAF
ncbi:MAG: translocation/assembly module TamB domain-containing protein [Acidobacteria bacterium]|nr:translocation/assembly module TamB domain-containing protein [Acidobacteriota bacterium]